MFSTSIKFRIITSGILLVIFAVGLVTATVYQHAKDALLELQAQQHVATASRLAAEFDQDLQLLRDTLWRVAQSISPERLNDKNYLSETLQNRPALQAMFPGGVVVVNARGDSIAEVSAGTHRVGTNVSSRDWFQQVASQNNPIIGEPYIGGASKHTLFVIAAPIGRAGESFAGALVATIYLDGVNIFRNVFQADVKATDEHRRLQVISRKSHVLIASLDNKDVMQPIVETGRNAMRDTHMSGKEGTIIAVNPRGIEELTAAKSMSMVPWSIVVATAIDSVLKPVEALQFQAFLWGGASAMLAALVLWIITSRFLAPVSLASQQVRQQLEDATLGTTPLPEGGNDEIGILLRGFNELYAKVQSTARLLNSILDNSTVGITFVKDRKQLWANQHMGEIFGYALEEMNSQSTRMFYPSDDAFLSFGAEAYPVLLHDQRFVKELVMQRKDGTPVWTRISGKMVDASDPGAGSIWVLEDISEQRDAEAALRESEAKLRTIADYTYDWESWQAPDGHFIYVSPSCVEITGHTSDEFKADPTLASRIIHPADLQAYASHLQHIENKGLCELEFRIRTKAGDVRWIDHGCRPIHDANGNYIGRRSSNRDVTATKEAELQYRTIVQTAQDGYLVVAQDTHFIDTNEAYCQMLGYSRDELLALKVADVDVEEDPREIERHTAEMRRDGHAKFETRHRRKDGTVIDVEVTVQYLELHGGVLITFIRDITARKRIERQLQEERGRFKDFSASSADWFWEMDANLRFSYFSDNFEDVYGLKPDALLGCSRPEILARDQLNPQPALNAHLAQLEKHEPFRNCEYRIRDSAGNIRWISVSGLPFNDFDGRFAGYRGIGQVITNRKNAEAQIRESTERLQAAASAGIVGVWDWDLEHNRLVCDKVMHMLYGLEETDGNLSIDTWFAAIHPDDRAYIDGEIQAALRGEGEYAPEFRVVWPDASIHHIKARSNVTFDQQGKPLRLVGVSYDITEQKNIEVMLEQGIAERTHELKKAREAAEAANVAKTAFLANMSHEMRTPLHQISGMAQLIRREPLTPKQMDRCEKLELAARNLTSIIDTILEMTKIEAGQLDHVDSPFSPQELLEGVIASVQTQVSAKELRLSHILENVPATLVGDQKLIRQALLNYVVNAIRFTETGEIVIRVKPAITLGDYVLIRFEVDDTGPGILPEDEPRLFSIFEQVDNSSTRKFGGIGMGLAMTKKIAEVMGGEAGYTSKPDIGSIFWFTVRVRRG